MTKSGRRSSIERTSAQVDDIKRLGPCLGPGVAMKEIPDGKHDLTLSCSTPRELCLETMVEWAMF